jgi:hypothetical protein
VAAHHRDRRAAAVRERVFRQLGNWTFSSMTKRPLPVARLGSSQRKASWASNLCALTGVQGMWSWLDGRRRRNSLGRCGDARRRKWKLRRGTIAATGDVRSRVGPGGSTSRKVRGVGGRAKAPPQPADACEAIAAKNRVTLMP